MAPGTLARLVPTTAPALGILRAVVCGFFLVSILLTNFADLARLPATVMRPTGAMQFFPWQFYDRLITPTGMLTLKALLAVSLSMSAVGYLTPLSTKCSAALVLFNEGLLRSFGHFNHDEMLAVYALVVLAFTPCGDAFAVDSLPDAQATKRSGAVKYGYPILLMRVLVAWAYFSSALIKLRVAGLGYFSPDSLPALAVQHSLDNLHDTHFTYAFRLAEYRGPLTTAAVALVITWELLFPLALFLPRARRLILAFGVVFHVSTVFVMNVFFPFHLLMYAAFMDWPSVARRVSSTSPFGRVARWWRDFRGVPECFPLLRAGEGVPRATLLWDGDCGFCARWVERLRRFARRPFDAQPYQSLAGELPPELLRWSNKQMHWVDESGRVYGGSRALARVLAESGHGFLAALLQSAPLRPFAWLGYRIAARNR